MRSVISRMNPFAIFRFPLHAFVGEKLRSPFPFYLNDERKNTVLVLGISLFVVAFLITFNPEHVHKLNKVLLVGVVTFVVMFSSIVLLPRLLPSWFDTLRWTIGKYLLFTLGQFMVLGVAIAAALYVLEFYPDRTFGELVLTMYPRVFTNGFITVTLVTMMLRNYMLKENLRDAIRANEELAKIRSLKKADPKHPNVNLLTIHSDTSETLTLNLPDLLYIEASDNYSTVYWKNGHGVEKKLLRANMKNLESQLNNSFALRCHRSFIVNINAITHISGNTNGYKLTIRDTAFSVPVSRSKGKEVIEKLEQLRNMIEMC